jgi:hypothetical protein
VDGFEDEYGGEREGYGDGEERLKGEWEGNVCGWCVVA